MYSLDLDYDTDLALRRSGHHLQRVLNGAADPGSSDIELGPHGHRGIRHGQLQRERLALTNRDQMQMEMEHILTTRTAIGAEEIDRLGTHGALQPGCNAFCQCYAMRGKVIGQVEQCWVVVLGYNQRVTTAHRLNIQERDGPVVLVYDTYHFFTADDAAKDTALVDHTLSSGICCPQSWPLILQDARRASQIALR